jgi:hypothetical protein
LRTSLFDDEVDGAVDDLDLYLYPPGEDPLEDGEFIALSGGGTSEEQIDIPSPEAGDWTLVVHGWETDGADAIYTLFTWVVGSADAGNLAAVPSTATAVVGETATITLSWGPPLVPLTADTRYLGIVRYSDGVGSSAARSSRSTPASPSPVAGARSHGRRLGGKPQGPSECGPWNNHLGRTGYSDGTAGAPMDLAEVDEAIVVVRRRQRSHSVRRALVSGAAVQGPAVNSPRWIHSLALARAK